MPKRSPNGHVALQGRAQTGAGATGSTCILRLCVLAANPVPLLQSSRGLAGNAFAITLVQDLLCECESVGVRRTAGEARNKTYSGLAFQNFLNSLNSPRLHRLYRAQDPVTQRRGREGLTAVPSLRERLL